MSTQAVYDFYRGKLTTTFLNSIGVTTVVVDGQSFTPTAQSYPFIRFTVMPRESIQREIGMTGIQQYPGLARIDLWYNRTTAEAAALGRQAADALVHMLMTDPELGDISDMEQNQVVTESAWAEQPRAVNTSIDVPVFIRYNNYVRRV